MAVIDNLNIIIENLKKHINYNVNIIAVSKTFSFNTIKPLIHAGHIHFGENRVGEALEKWFINLSSYPNIKIHLIGKLQSNKVRDAVKIFSYIHSLDSERLAIKLREEEKKQNKNLKYFIQVNFDNEKQKGGISENEVFDFVNFCKNENCLDVIGLMCIPPINQPAEVYFQKLQLLSQKNNLSDLSMGMSNDYIKAINFGANYIRIGSLIFGDRK